MVGCGIGREWGAARRGAWRCDADAPPPSTPSLASVPLVLLVPQLIHLCLYKRIPQSLYDHAYPLRLRTAGSVSSFCLGHPRFLSSTRLREALPFSRFFLFYVLYSRLCVSVKRARGSALKMSDGEAGARDPRLPSRALSPSLPSPLFLSSCSPRPSPAHSLLVSSPSSPTASLQVAPPRSSCALPPFPLPHLPFLPPTGVYTNANAKIVAAPL